MKLVEFENGKYGIRVGSYFMGYKFKDLITDGYHWNLDSKYISHCMGSLEDCYKVTNQLKYKVLHKL